MARWEQGARDRLRAAALELFAEHGYDTVTASQIAARAGVTERTFFRHFKDKREVVFPTDNEFVAAFIDAADPDASSPFDAVAAMVRGGVRWFAEERREGSRMRGAVIAATPALQEREELKLRVLGDEMAAALRERGVPEPTAGLAGQTGVAVFRLAFTQWLAAGETRTLTELVDDGLGALRAVFEG